MNIISINKFYWIKGGCETVFFGEKALLEEYGHTVLPFSMHHPNNLISEYSEYFVSEKNYEKNGIMNKAKLALNIIYSFEAQRNMEHLLRTFTPHIAHVHNVYHQISPSIFTPLKKHNIPVVLTLHDLKPICPSYVSYNKGEICEKCYGQRFYQCTLNRCTKNSAIKSFVNSIEMYLHYLLGFYQGVDKYIAVSQFYRNKMLANGFGEQQVVYLPNFIDVGSYPLRKMNDKEYILYFGRLTQEKGLDTLLESAKLCPRVKIIIAGTGPEEKHLRESAQSMPNVSFVGFQTGKALHDLIRQASATVLPSKWYENCPMSILESLALAIPVIGSRIGGIPELIDEGVDGMTFESGNAFDLANKINTLLEYSASRRKEMGMAGRYKIEKKFSSQLHYEGLFDIYKSLITFGASS